MAEALKRIPFEEFSDNLVNIFERVIREHETVLVESDTGAVVEVRHITVAKSRRRVKSQEDYEAFLASAGGWADIDIDAFLEDNEESRRFNTRPPVEL